MLDHRVEGSLPHQAGSQKMEWIGPETSQSWLTLGVKSLVGHPKSENTQGDEYMASVFKELKLNTESAIILQTSRITYLSVTGKVQNTKSKRAAISHFFSW